MNYQTIREECCEANRSLPKTGLVDLTFGNVSVLDAAAGVFAIKPSGVGYAQLRPEDMVIVDLEGQVKGHGPFVWHVSAAKAVEYALALEVVADMALKTLALEPNLSGLSGALLDKHFLRKHGQNAYYGQGSRQ
jgi:ribulose-5-phosphate 4-epimerase/fuculose-1-phosphate aldolase